MNNRILEEAQREIGKKSRAEIEAETAWKWAARAAAAYVYYETGRTVRSNEHWLADATDYYHEAIEHAALADHSGTLLREVRRWVHQFIPKGL